MGHTDDPYFPRFSPQPNTLTYPQSVVPNRFDLFFSSHNIWHICILVAIFFWHSGLLEYSEALHTLGCAYLDEGVPPT